MTEPTNPALCTARWGAGPRCTEPLGHEGDHVFRDVGVTGDVVRIPREGRPTPSERPLPRCDARRWDGPTNRWGWCSQPAGHDAPHDKGCRFDRVPCRICGCVSPMCDATADDGPIHLTCLHAVAAERRRAQASVEERMGQEKTSAEGAGKPAPGLMAEPHRRDGEEEPRPAPSPEAHTSDALPWPEWPEIKDALTDAGVCSLWDLAESGDMPKSVAYTMKLAALELREGRERMRAWRVAHPDWFAAATGEELRTANPSPPIDAQDSGWNDALEYAAKLMTDEDSDVPDCVTTWEDGESVAAWLRGLKGQRMAEGKTTK